MVGPAGGRKGAGGFSVSRRRIVFQPEHTVVRSGSLSIIKNCQMHFGRCGRITAGARNPVGSSPGVTAGYSPEGEGGWDGGQGGDGSGGKGKGNAARGRLGSLVCTVAQSLASVLLLARILIDFENTIFCANDQNAARSPLATPTPS